MRREHLEAKIARAWEEYDAECALHRLRLSRDLTELNHLSAWQLQFALAYTNDEALHAEIQRRLEGI